MRYALFRLLLVGCVAVPVAGIVWMLIAIYGWYSDDQAVNHTVYPAVEHRKPEGPPTRYERFEAVKRFVTVNGRPNVVRRDMRLSDERIGRADCRQTESEIRVVTPVIDPTTGDQAPDEITMYFCVDIEGSVRAADARTLFFTTRD